MLTPGLPFATDLVVRGIWNWWQFTIPWFKSIIHGSSRMLWESHIQFYQKSHMHVFLVLSHFRLGPWGAAHHPAPTLWLQETGCLSGARTLCFQILRSSVLHRPSVTTAGLGLQHKRLSVQHVGNCMHHQLSQTFWIMLRFYGRPMFAICWPLILRCWHSWPTPLLLLINWCSPLQAAPPLCSPHMPWLPPTCSWLPQLSLELD